MADRAFRQLVALAVVTLVPLTIGIAITLFPGSVQRALHGSDAFVQTCLAAVYGLGETLPPLGLAVLALGLASFVAGTWRLLALMTRTRAMTAHCLPCGPSGRVRRTFSVLGLADGVTVFDSQVPLAFTAGLRRPRIWISTAAVRALREDELCAVLLHERAHLLRRDPLRIAVGRLVSAALFFVPLAEELRRRSEAALELDADRQVLAAQRDPAALAGALARLGVVAQPLGPDIAVGAWSLTAARIDQLEGAPEATLLPAPSALGTWIAALALAGLVLLVLGQGARANVLPAAAWQLAGAPTGLAVHACPLPLEGPLF